MVSQAIGPQKTAFKVLAAISFCHLLNDAIQALIPAIYPLLKESFQLNFTQIGLITFTFQRSARFSNPSWDFTPTSVRSLTPSSTGWESLYAG